VSAAVRERSQKNERGGEGGGNEWAGDGDSELRSCARKHPAEARDAAEKPECHALDLDAFAARLEGVAELVKQ
jgi:hypothetical protein